MIEINDTALDLMIRIQLVGLSFAGVMGSMLNHKPNHSVLRFFTGFVNAAFTAWKLIVNGAINNAQKPATRKIYQLAVIL
jgi:hypothetical protein